MFVLISENDIYKMEMKFSTKEIFLSRNLFKLISLRGEISKVCPKILIESDLLEANIEDILK